MFSARVGLYTFGDRLNEVDRCKLKYPRNGILQKASYLEWNGRRCFSFNCSWVDNRRCPGLYWVRTDALGLGNTSPMTRLSRTTRRGDSVLEVYIIFMLYTDDLRAPNSCSRRAIILRSPIVQSLMNARVKKISTLPWILTTIRAVCKCVLTNMSFSSLAAAIPLQS